MSRPTTPSSPAFPSFSNTVRASTAPAKSKHHIPHHSHHHHHHHNRENSVPQHTFSANAFGDFLNPITRIGSRGNELDSQQQSRPPSLVLREAREAREAKAKEEERQTKEWEQVSRLREKRKAMDEELRTSLQSLSNLGTTTTRRLDYTYYSLLEKVSSLVSNIEDLRELSNTTTSLRQDFEIEARNLEKEIAGQVSAFGNFDTQRVRIEGLEMRMKEGRAKVEELGGRLGKVRSGVEAWEKKEVEWQIRTSRRLRMLWGSIAGLLGLAGLFIVLLMFKRWGKRRLDAGEAWSVDRGVGANTALPVGLTDERMVKTSSTSRRPPSSSTILPDPILQLFDEL